jgi:transcriptional regulator with XRE-family HTH domain
MVVFFMGDAAVYFRRIEDLRSDNDKTQRWVAGYLHMNLEVYRRYEKGVREIPVWALIRLSELYGVSVDYLLGLTDDPKRA